MTKHVHVTGRVQGVAFRAWTQRKAESLGVSGWVRNRSDGSVEAVISGDDEAVEALIAALHEGPPTASVEDVHLTETEEAPGEGFRIAH